MLALNFNDDFSDPLIQENWRRQMLPHFTGIVLGNGKIVAMGETAYSYNGTSHHHVYAICASTIDSFVDLAGEFVDIVPMADTLPLQDGAYHGICGEGPMGNEGFVALVRAGVLIWAAFFTGSNPFHALSIKGDSMLAKSTHDRVWEFPLHEPWNARVLGADSA